MIRIQEVSMWLCLRSYPTSNGNIQQQIKQAMWIKHKNSEPSCKRISHKSISLSPSNTKKRDKTTSNCRTSNLETNNKCRKNKRRKKANRKYKKNPRTTATATNTNYSKASMPNNLITSNAVMDLGMSLGNCCMCGRMPIWRRKLSLFLRECAGSWRPIRMARLNL